MRCMNLLLACLLLTACAQTKVMKEPDLDIYLRADFTYWEAKPEFRFKLNQELGIKYLTAYIQYDGQPYQFVIADRLWSENQNCGFAERKDRVLKYNQWLELNCNYNVAKNAVTPIQKPFEFLPKGSGKYQFELKLDLNNSPTHIRVSKVKSKSTKNTY